MAAAVLCTGWRAPHVDRPGARPSADWPTHGGDPGHRQFSTLDQINTGNVASLKVAWTYRTRDAQPDNRSQIQCNPIVVHGVLYATSAAAEDVRARRGDRP